MCGFRLNRSSTFNAALMTTSKSHRNMLRLVFISMVFSSAQCGVKLSSEEITLEVGQVETVQLEIKNVPANYLNKSALFVVEQENIAQVTKKLLISSTQDNGNTSWTYDVKIEALKAGKSGLSITVVTQHRNIEQAVLFIKVYRSNVLEWLSSAIGWSYFLVWSISFYPQIFTNYMRKSVVGLNFDFLLFSLFGYIMYNIFNFGVYFVPLIQDQYSIKHPKSFNPVRPNDIFFSAHSFFATVATISQSIVYEKGNQKVSTTAKIIIQIYIAVVTTSVFLAMMDFIWWLDVVYICSYIKLCIAIKKYLPQAYMNYRRKSTQGFSIGGIALDLLGGLLSIFQMVLDGYNYGDWSIFIENPTKFGLGTLSDGFCLTFLIQHFLLYRNNDNKNELELDNHNV